MKIRINYKSGNSQVLKVQDYTVNWSTLTGEVTELTVVGYKNKFIFVGLNNIESIWRIK